ncbi:PPOX class F420-dependent oxidoreductase [Pseudonocardia sp. GCM10023141]|uniref:PPOX class F420-dependent oxidoreductase n=1 Tax=Pseudonocardia sp. GCM10023141 TaxID=3252653 RepID=UPI00360DD9E7
MTDGAFEIPEGYADLLERPLIAHLATVRADGAPQANPMWFGWDGEFVRFTNTRKRRKFQNVSTEPRVAVSINDPERPYRYLEVRGTVVRIEDDPEATFFMELAERYGLELDGPPADAPDRVIFVVRPEATSKQ